MDERDDRSSRSGEASSGTTVAVERDYDGVGPDDLRMAVERALESEATRLRPVTRDSPYYRDGSTVATSDPSDVGNGTVEYKPYGPQAALAIVVGLIFALPSIFVSLVVTFVGMYYYRKDARGELPVVRRDVIDVDVVVRNESEETVVEYAGETALAVDADRLEDVDWPLRKEIVARVTDWHGRVVDGDPLRENFDDVFFGHLTMWRERDATTDVDEVESLQRELASTPASRREYANHLHEHLPDAAFEGREQDLLAYLEELADDVEARVSADGTDAR